MADRIAELEEQVSQLTAAKNSAYDDLIERDRLTRQVERDLVEANVLLVRECARSTALDVEATVYRERYNKAIARMSALSRSVLIANAARDYIDAIKRRGSLEDDVVAALTRLTDEVNHSDGHGDDPQHEHIVELDHELTAMRAGMVVLWEKRDQAAAQIEDLEGQAGDWQELAETSDRKLVEAQRKLQAWEQWPSDARHALGHVVDCDDNCDQCRRLAADALERCP